MDDHGYVALHSVLRILKGLPNFRWATRADVDAVIALPGRRRFEIVAVEGDERIRALYGHTAIRPTYSPVTPPDVLYHGTTLENVAAIEREGLRPMARQYVHLATTPEIARSIALRNTTEPVILCVDAAGTSEAGGAFYCPVDEIYLCNEVPPEYVSQSS
jgi:putative RNA 2'-phosphotransferase